MTQISPELLDRLGLSRPEQKQDKDMDRLGQSDFLKLMTTSWRIRTRWSRWTTATSWARWRSSRP